MKKFCIPFFLFILCIGHAGYCSVVTDDLSENPESLVSIQDIVPETLSTYLIEKGIDVTLPTGIVSKNGEEKLFLFKPSPQVEYLMLRKNLDGTGILLLLNSNSHQDEESIIITFDTARDVFTAQQVSEGCIRHISSTIQSLISVIYYCVAVPNIHACIVNIIDLITDIILIPTECAPEEG